MDDKSTKIRIGMVGGGFGAGIGESHRIGMRLDNRYALLAGSFSRDAKQSRAFGLSLDMAPDRLYETYQAMAEAEAARPDGIEVVSIVTTNESHHAIARAFLERGIAVLCEKPLTPRLAEAMDLYRLASDNQLVFALAHNYSAYAMVRQAARMVREGVLGKVRIVQAEHASGWAAEPLELGDHRQARWRTDPEIAGAASVVYDLGTHAHQLLRCVTGLEVTALAAELSTVVPGRRVWDNAQVALRLSNGATGSLWASMAATGQEHGLRIRVFGERASLDWRHEVPHHLTVRYGDGSSRILAQGGAGLSHDADRVTRAGLGHPEGFLESFANLYTDVAEALLRRRGGGPMQASDIGYPTAWDGVMGVRFVEAVVASHEAGGRWTDATMEL
jgi:predicted dehydrogenase